MVVRPIPVFKLHSLRSLRLVQLSRAITTAPTFHVLALMMELLVQRLQAVQHLIPTVGQMVNQLLI